MGTAHPHVQRRVYLSVGVLSLVFIALQLNLIRILSALLSYHYVFSVVSLAMLGLGLGGVVVQFFVRSNKAQGPTLARLAWLTALCTLVSMLLLLWMAQQPIFFSHFYAYFLVVLLPFILGGAFFAYAYKVYSAQGSQLYAADLLGAALGCLFGVLLLNWLGAIDSSFLLSGLVAFIAWYLVRGQGAVSGWQAGVFLLTAVIAVCAAGVGQYLQQPWLGSTERNPIKEIADAIDGPLQGTVTQQRWSAFGLTEQVQYQRTDEHRDIYIDGTAGTPMYAFTGDTQQPGQAVEKLLRFFPGALPLQLMPAAHKNRALVIGPGGGRDILLAATLGFDEVVGVEVNPDLLALVQEQADYNGGLYTNFAHIQVEQAEGRHFIQRDQSLYDLIMLSLPVTNTSRSPEGFALTENFLLTTEALEDYLYHLTDHGQLLVITHDELAVIRLLSVALAAYERLGWSSTEALERMYVLGSFPYPIVVMGLEPFTAELSAQLFQASQQRNYSINASYFPHALAQGQGNPMLQAMAAGQLSVAEMQDYIQGLGHDVSTVTDDRPFFYHFDFEPPKTVMALLYAALGSTLVVWLISSFVGLRLKQGGKRTRRPAISTAFAALGVGFMLFEIVLVQRLTFYLGDPVLALALLLTVLFLGMAAGSAYTTVLNDQSLRRNIVRAAVTVVALGGIYLLLLPAWLHSTLLWPLWGRFAFSWLLLLPIGFVLGLCFPLFIRLLNKQQDSAIIPWMWAINGCASVLGAALAVLGALYYGFDAVQMLGLALYVVVALSALYMRTEQPRVRPR